MSSHIAQGLLEQDLIHQFHDLLRMIEERDERFFWFNDIYFMNRCQEIRLRRQDQGSADRGADRDASLSESPRKRLIIRFSPIGFWNPTTMSGEKNERLLKQIKATLEEFEQVLDKHGKRQSVDPGRYPGKRCRLYSWLEPHRQKARKRQSLSRARSGEGRFKEREAYASGGARQYSDEASFGIHQFRAERLR